MITSWNDFFIAVEQMRQCQKEYFRTKNYSALMASKRCEAAVDNFIKIKHAERVKQIQPELMEANYE